MIIQDMLKRLVQNGFSYKQNSILGDVFNYLEKTKAQVLTHTSSMYVEEPEILKKTKSDELGKKCSVLIFLILLISIFK